LRAYTLGVFRRRRMREDVPEESRRFDAVLGEVERAKAAVVAAVPSARAPGRPLADALFEFDDRLAAAASLMDSWRTEHVADAWKACADGIAEARGRGERLRLDAPDLGFESLLGAIQELIDPLDAFELAAARLRELGSLPRQ
jgi:hypothetical protein